MAERGAREMVTKASCWIFAVSWCGRTPRDGFFGGQGGIFVVGVWLYTKKGKRNLQRLSECWWMWRMLA